MFSRFRKKIFRLFDIDVYLDITWFLVFIFMTISFAPVWKSLLNARLFFPLAYLLSAVMVILIYITLLAHEFSHSLIAKKFGIPVRQITLFFLGGVAHIEKSPENPGHEFKMAIAGPLASLIVAALFFGLYWLIVAVHLYSPILWPFFIGLIAFNLLVAIFNLIPAFPMDGGRVFRAIIWRLLKDQVKATKIAVIVATVLGLAMIISSIPVFRNPFLILIGLFIIQGGRSELKFLILQKKLQPIRVRDIMTPCVPYSVDEAEGSDRCCSADDDLWTVTRKMIETKIYCFRVVNNELVVGHIGYSTIMDYSKKTD